MHQNQPTPRRSRLEVFDATEGKATILMENHMKITQKVVDAWDNDFERRTVDYKSTAAGCR
ncbi:MAG: hypothetical protein AAB347_01205 [Bacteroidota bacterium]